MPKDTHIYLKKEGKTHKHMYTYEDLHLWRKWMYAQNVTLNL